MIIPRGLNGARSAGTLTSAMETTLRSAVADYELGEALAPGCYRARPPERLGFAPDAVVRLWEVAVDGAGWPEVSSDMALFASVDSPNLIRLFEAGPDLDPTGAGAYLVSEDPPGGSLASPTRPLQLGEMISAAAGAARGAHALHEAGLAHGSISAESIFLADRGCILGPPGPAGPGGAVVRVDRWQALEVLDPELLRGAPAGRSTDVWALAASLHQVCSGTSLYPGLDREQTVTAVQKVLYGPPTVASTLPSDLAGLLERCFDRDPSTRPATALELADRLEELNVIGGGG